MQSITKQLTNAALLVLWWIGLWGIVDYIVDALKLSAKGTLYFYVALVLVTTLIIYWSNQESVSLLD